MSPISWGVAAGALVTVGLGIAVAVLGIKLGRARADVAEYTARLLGADAKIGRITTDRDQALAQLADERGRSTLEIAGLRRDAEAAHDALAKALPPGELRKKLQGLLGGAK